MDSARLRAAVADERYWRPDHPEQAAWRAWVAEGFQAMYGAGGEPQGGIVHVRAYVRNGQQVAAHTRGAPAAGAAGDSGKAAGARVPPDEQPRETGGAGLGSLVLRRRNLLDDARAVQVMARRPEDALPGGRRPTPFEGGGGGGGAFRGPANSGARPSPSAPRISERSQELVDVLAPGGRPIGSQYRGSREDIRTLPGGEREAQAMFGRLTEGRIVRDRTPAGHPGRMVELDDGSVIGFRPGSSSGSPAVDINIPGFSAVTKRHF